MLKSNLCDYINTYILVKGDVIIIEQNKTQLAFKNCSPFTKCIPKINRITIDEAGNLDLVVLWFYSKDDPTSFNVDISESNNVKFFS